MISKNIGYFERTGRENTEDIIDIVAKRLEEGDIHQVVVASSLGTTGLRFAKRLAKDTKLVIVSSAPGRTKPGVWDFDRTILTELEGLGCTVIRQTHVLSGLDRSMSGRFSGISNAEFLAESLRKLFGNGMKVAIECTLMAADGGVISMGKTIAVGGHGKGADCAIVALPAHACNFFDFRVLEILAKPF